MFRKNTENARQFRFLESDILVYPKATQNGATHAKTKVIVPVVSVVVVPVGNLAVVVVVAPRATTVVAVVVVVGIPAPQVFFLYETAFFTI